MSRTYYLIMERPLGAHCWTFAAIAGDKESAKRKADEIVVERGNCTWVVTARLPKAPDETLYSVMHEPGQGLN